MSKSSSVSSEVNGSNVPNLKIIARDNDLKNSARDILRHIKPQWQLNSVTFRMFTNGITNRLVGCYLDDDPDDMVLIRIYGTGTEYFIDRNDEITYFKVLSARGFAPKLFATFTNGLAYSYVPGVTLDTNSVREEHIYPLVARMLAKFHKLEPIISKPVGPMLWSKLQAFVDLIPKTEEHRFKNIIAGGLDWLKDEIASLKNKTSRMYDKEIVFCHNDLLMSNIIYNDNKVTFIDYEYAGYNYQAFDIGNHFDEFCGLTKYDSSRYPSKEFQLEWIRVYLREYKIENEPIGDEEVKKMYDDVCYFAPLANFMWSVWALVQDINSNLEFDYLKLAKERFEEYRKYRVLYFPENKVVQP